MTKNLEVKVDALVAGEFKLNRRIQVAGVYYELTIMILSRMVYTDYEIC